MNAQGSHDTPPPTLSDQIAELDRELRLRRHVYPKFIAGGRLKQKDGNRQIECIEAAIATLKELEAKERLL